MKEPQSYQDMFYYIFNELNKQTDEYFEAKKKEFDEYVDGKLKECSDIRSEEYEAVDDMWYISHGLPLPREIDK